MKKRLLTAWIIACMFICLVGQTPITALADGDDTRVISVPEGLQEVLNYDTPEVQTVEEENTTEDANEVQTEVTDETNEVQGENDLSETPETQTVQEDLTAENPVAQTMQDNITAETPQAQTEQDETVITETPANQTIQKETSENAQQITETNLTVSIVASDGNTYETNVTYTSESGIPMEGTVLQVTELVSDDEGYDEYLEESASKVGVDTEDILFSKVFDIKIVDENDENIEYEPTGNVDVSIRVVGVSLDEFANVNVLHFVEDKNDENFLVYDVDTTVSEETVEFSTDSFSVYVVIGHEGEEVVTPRVEFHFIAKDAQDYTLGNEYYYVGNPYPFKNKGEIPESDPTTTYTQYTQIIKDGESLELIEDPLSIGSTYFYGWYVVDSKVISVTTDDYGIGKSDNKLYYTWPANPDRISFESPISIEKSTDEGDDNDTFCWSINGVSGKGKADEDGNLHVFLAPVFDNYHFVNFMLRPYGTDPNNLMTRKMIALGSASTTEVKISDVRSNSTDPVHLVFTGWGYFDADQNKMVSKPIIDYSGAPLIDEGKDGVYMTIELSDSEYSFDLFPIFVEARWVDFFSGNSASGAKYVPSRFLESWGTALNPTNDEIKLEHEKNLFTSLPTTIRSGYNFDGWYAFANIDPVTGNITNLQDEKYVDISYITFDNDGNYVTNTATVNTRAVKVANGDGSVHDSGTWSITNIRDDGNGNKIGDLVNDASDLILIETNEFIINEGEENEYTSNGIRFYDSLDRIKLSAKWSSDESKVTVIYWTENPQEQGYSAPEAPTLPDSTNPNYTELKKQYDEDYAEYVKALKAEYTAAAVKVISTGELNDNITHVNPFLSGSELTLSDLNDYSVNETKVVAVEENNTWNYNNVVSSTDIINTAYLDDIGAVLSGEEKFYDLNTDLSDDSVIIKGDGSTTFNVFYSRKTFKLVFHIGRDNYVKNSGHQKTDNLWDGNWIEFMYKDGKVTELGYPPEGATGRKPGNSYSGLYSMTYLPENKTYTSAYVTSHENVMGDYIPDPDPNSSTYDSNDENVYVIEAKYGAYIGNKWPTPTNTSFFRFDNPSGSTKTMYIWAAYYGSLYCRIANDRLKQGDHENSANPDINGIYEYMSAELCSNRSGNDIINDHQVHHLVAYFGEANNYNRYKRYHILYEAIDGTYDSNQNTTLQGDNYVQYELTSWANKNTSGDKSEIIGKEFIEKNSRQVISNLEPQFQLSENIEGYELVYSCYNSSKNDDGEYDVYFFYRPKQYTLTFNLGNSIKSDNYYYTEILENADKYTNDVVVPEGYSFKGWYTNTEGIGSSFDFANETMPSQNVVLYPYLKADSFVVKIDPNGGVIDNRANTSVSTYFNANYGTQVGEYYVKKDFIKLSDKEQDPTNSDYYDPTVSGQEWYYYINTQRLGIPSEGDWGLPTELRNAVYVTETELNDYYEWYSNIIDNTDLGWWSGISKLSKTEFIRKYTKYPYRPVKSGEIYSFMGWYQVFDDCTVASMPYNFNDPVKDTLELRALWRLNDGYYIQYDPNYLVEEEGGYTYVVGQMIDNVWTDPANLSSETYADQSSTFILHAPTKITPGWVFRGWRVVRQNGETTIPDFPSYPNWEAYKDDTYYQPGDSFIVNDELVSDSSDFGKIIHMQAWYEREDTSHRRPEVTNLTLDPNQSYGGRIVNVNSLPSLGGPGNQDIKYESGNNPIQILIGDVQSNLALHLNGYADLFSNDDKYLLIGFDENINPTSPKTGKAYIPTFALDSVASVTRKSDDILYAMWEPMVYAKFVNTTDEDLEIDLSGTAGTISIINEANGFDRKAITTTKHITVPKKKNGENGIVKVAFPGATPGIDSITAETTNNHPKYKLSVNGVLNTENPYGTGDQNVQYGNLSHYTGTLNTDPDGIIITYTEDEIPSVIFDKNGADVWNEQSTWFSHSQTDEDIYIIQEDGIAALNRYKPADPQQNGKIFLGWTTNADIAAQTDFSSEVPVTLGSTPVAPDSGDIILNKIKSDYLWDFEDNPPYGRTLYAVWSDAVTVTFDIVKTGNDLHTWTEEETESTNEPYVFFRESQTSKVITYTLAKGERVPKPSDPTAYQQDWYFVAWLQNDTSRRNTTKNPTDPTIMSKTFDFSQRVNSNITLSTSWTANMPQIFTFTVENHVMGNPNEEFNYTIAVSEEKVFGKIGTSSKNIFGDPDQHWGSVTTNLKNNETYTVQIKVLQSTYWGNSTKNPPTYSIEIDVIDGEGNLIKSGHVIYCNNNTDNTNYAGKNFSSDYKYVLTIVQDEKAGYDTTVGVKDRNNVDLPPEGYVETSDSERKYTFYCSHWGTESQANNFNPLTNEYTGNESNSLTVVFTNTSKAVVAPTNYSTNYKPFFMMFGFGAILVGLIVPPIIMFRRRRQEEE